MSGYNWTYGMSNNAVLAYRTGEKPRSRWTKPEMLEEIADVYGDVAGVAKLTKEELFTVFFYNSSWHHCSGAFNRVYFYSVREDISSPAERVAEMISSRTPKQKVVEPNLYITAKVMYKISVKSRRGWKSEWVTDTVQYRSQDKIVSTYYGNKRVSSLSFLDKIEQKTKYAPIEKLKGVAK